jgi:non-specific serine/threonine protein kinase
MDQIEDLLHRALERPPEERTAFLASICSDSALVEEVMSLLAAHEEAGGFLDSPPRLPGARESADGGARLDASEAGAFGSSVCPQCKGRFAEAWVYCPYDGNSLVADPMAVIGTTLDGIYRIEELLGQGSQGAVYRARHLLLDDVVAVKLLTRHVSHDPVWLERFRREGRAARRFRHPNAVTVHDLRAEEGGFVYLVLEYVDGPTLRKELARRGRFSLSEALEVLDPVAGVLDAAHAAGVVHRDLKPDNIILGRDRDARALVKVLDLGIAKLCEAPGKVSAELTQEGQLLGTPYYMAPEQWGRPSRDGVAEIDGRADVYSLGLIAYELVVGERPFSGATAGDLRLQHVTATVPLAHEKVAGLPESFGQAVARAMAKDRADRQANAGELVRALRASLGAGETLRISEPFATSGKGSGAASATHATEHVPTMLEAHEAAGAHNLPLQLTSFVGREPEIAQLQELLRAARLLTLIGTGGVGKSRLAQELALQVAAEYTGGVRLVELAALMDPTLVVDAVMTAVGVREHSGKAPLATLCDALKAQRILLLLDNCEHVISACVELADELLRGCPALRVLATSREPLGIVGEVLWRVPPLSMPDPDEAPDVATLARSEAIRLFVERARLNRPEFDLTRENARAVAAVCRRLEGIPLAIELAAARVRALTLEQILARMDEHFRLLTGGGRTRLPRHQTMKGAIAWSYGLLGSEERLVFERLAVFSGGFTLEAAEAVCGEGGGRREEGGGGVGSRVPGAGQREVEPGLPEIARWEPSTRHPEAARHPGPGTQHPAPPPPPLLPESVLDVVASLIDKSLLQPARQTGATARFEMLEMIREFGLERLQASGEAEPARRRHAAYYLALAEVAAPELTGVRQSEWMERLEGEYDNVRAALAWTLDHEPESGLRLASAFRNFWALHGHLAEARRWLEAALGRTGCAPSVARMKALDAAAHLAWRQGDLPAARLHFEESLGIAHEIGNTLHVAWSSYGLGIVAYIRGDMTEARARFEEGLVGGEELGDSRLVSSITNCLGEMARLNGEWAEARKHYDHCLLEARKTGARDIMSTVLVNLGAVACEEGDLAAATACFREALSMDRRLVQRDSIASCLDGLAVVAARQSSWDRSARLAGAAQALRDVNGSEVEPADCAFRERYLAEVRTQLGDVGYEAATAEGRALSLEQAVRLALEAPHPL